MDINSLWFAVAELLEEPLTEGPLYDLNHDHENGLTDYQARVSEVVDGLITSEWLRELRAQAWAEGFDAGERDALAHVTFDEPCITNPYRPQVPAED